MLRTITNFATDKLQIKQCGQMNSQQLSAQIDCFSDRAELMCCTLSEKSWSHQRQSSLRLV